MNGIIINIDPVIVHIGGFELRWYGLAIALAVIAAVLIATKEGRKHGISAENIQSMLPWALLGGIIGARLFHVVDRWEYYSAYPWAILQIQLGGFAIWGALAGGVAAAVIYARVKGISLPRLGDTMVPALLVAQIIGRVGCIINGDAYGSVTALPWGFVYTNPNALVPPNLLGVPTHPYPVYEMIWNGLTLLAVWRLGKAYRRDGFVFLVYLALYSLGRILLTFVRQENVWFWGLQEAQVIAGGVMIAAVAALAVIFRKMRAEAARA